MYTPDSVAELFSAVIAAKPGDRTTLLDAADPEVRQEVSELLRYDLQAEATDFLSPEVLVDYKPISTVGPYRLGEEIGRGGMGSVYRAERIGDFRQVVAIKLGPPGSSENSVLERFRGERQVLAALDHPHIARLFDGGATPDGRPYFVMELVNGQRLDQFVSSRFLPIRETVRLFTTVCRAVAYAQERGVIHRDLKPGNILVTEEGVVKVVDFGLATRTILNSADLTLTQTGQFLGTPGYCPPEQARGQSKSATAAADVFALGATLYTLLTGRAPFHADSQWETIRLTLEAEPLSPRRLTPSISRDLESICLKSLEKDPSRRYPTAVELADDLERFLNGIPTKARPISSAQRAWRWAKRYPLPAGLASTLAAVVIGAVVGITGLWLKAEASAEEARTHAAAVVERNKTAREALKAYTAVAGRLFRTPDQVSEEERQALATALELYVEVLAEGSDDPEEECDQAYSTLRLAVSMTAIGENDAAERANRRAIDVLHRLVEAYPDRGLYAHHLAEGKMQLAGLLWGTGREVEGTETGRRAVQVAEGLAASRPDSAECVGMCASLQANVGGRLVLQGELAEGERLLRAGVAGCQESLRLQPEHWPRYTYYAHAVQSHARAVLSRTGSLEEYAAAVHPLFEFIDATARDRPDDWPQLLPVPLQIAREICAILWWSGEHATARRYLTRLAELTGQVAHRRPADPTAARNHALTLFDLALVTANEAEAAGRFRAALQAIEPTADRPSTAASLADRAKLLAYCPNPAVRDPQTAVKLIREAVAADPGLIYAWKVLPLCLGEAVDFPGAVSELNRHQPGAGDRWAETSSGRFYKCLWQASRGERDVALAGLWAVEPSFAEVAEAELALLSLRERTWRQVTGGSPPELSKVGRSNR